MMWAFKRKLVIFGIVFVIIAGILSWIIVRVFFSHKPTCFDAKQNGEETGIDCGGGCVRVCTSNARKLITRFARATPVTDTVYNLVARLENQNVDAGIENLSYRFRVYDSKNILITEKTGSTFIEANRSNTIFYPSVVVGSRIPAFTYFDILAEPDWKTVTTQLRRQLVTIDNQIWKKLDTTPTLTATVVNTNSFDLYELPIIATVYDTAGNIVASSATFVEILPEGGRSDIVFTWPESFDENPARVEIVARVNPFIQKDIN